MQERSKKIIVSEGELDEHRYIYALTLNAAMGICILLCIFWFSGINIFSICYGIFIVAALLATIFRILSFRAIYLNILIGVPSVFMPFNYPLWVGSIFSDSLYISPSCALWFLYSLLSSIVESLYIRRNKKYNSVILKEIKNRGDKYVYNSSIGVSLLTLSPIKRDSAFFWTGFIGNIQKFLVISSFIILGIGYLQLNQSNPNFAYTFSTSIFIFGVMARPMAVKFFVGQFAIYDFYKMKVC